MSERDVLIEYMKAKIEVEDWHAVSDAANDLREIDAVAKAKTDVSFLIEHGIEVKEIAIQGRRFIEVKAK